MKVVSNNQLKLRINYLKELQKQEFNLYRGKNIEILTKKLKGEK